jgi:hypothetical protein
MSNFVSKPNQEQVPLDKAVIELAVSALISEKRMIRRNGVVGWPVEDSDAARRLLAELEKAEQ